MRREQLGKNKDLSLSKRLLFLLLLICNTAEGQEFPTRHYTMRDGLCHATVYRIYQDRKGFLWFCTDYGLSVFDGRSFQNYTEKNGLTDKTILSVIEDPKGDMLVSTYRGGIDVIDHDSIRKLFATKGKIPEQIAYTLPEKDRLWLISFIRGNHLFVIEKDSVCEISIPWQGHESAVYKLFLLDGKVTVLTGSGIYTIDDRRQPVPFLQELFAGIPVYTLLKGRDGGYWVGTRNKVFHVAGNVVQDTFSCKGVIADMLIDRSGNTWFATEYGEVMLVRQGTLHNITSRLTLPKTAVTDLFEDSEGSIWLATQGLGVFRVHALDIINYPLQQSLLNNYCTTIVPGNGHELWIGSFGTLSKWTDGTLTAVRSSLTPSEIIYFIKKQDDQLLIGTPFGLLIKGTQPPYTERRILSHGAALSCCTDANGDVFIGGFASLYRFSKGKITLIDTSQFLKRKRLKSMVIDHEGALWAATDSAVIRYKDGAWSYPQLPGYKGIFKAERLLADRRQRLWFSTRAGLVCKSRAGYRIFTTKDGLSSNDCKHLYEDGNGRLWISSQQGLNTIDPGSFSISEFIADVDISEITSLHLHKGHLFIGTIGGLSVIDTRRLPPLQQQLPTYITQVRTGSGQYNMPDKLSLSYRDNNLRIDFAAIHFRRPERVEYRYRIDGLDSSWHYTRNNSVELSALPGGDYRFVLASRPGRGTWGKNVVLPITIAIPFWRTGWLLAVLITVLMDILSRTAMWRAAHIESKKKNRLMIRNQVTYLKHQALSALINPHFIFNCMNSIQHYLHRKDHEQASRYLSEFADLIRMTLEDTQEAFIQLGKELERIRLYLSLEKLRVGKKLNYEIILTPAISADEIRIPNMILQPYIENAIWHGIIPKKGPGKIIIRLLTDDPGGLLIQIEDNGAGIGSRAGHSTHRSMGMKLTETRLGLLNRLLNSYYRATVTDLKERNAQGTLVELRLPCRPNEQQIRLLEAEMNIIH